MLAALAEHGVEVMGFDNSPEMVQLAQEPLRARRLPGEALVADMAGFALDRPDRPRRPLGNAGGRQLWHELRARV